MIFRKVKDADFYQIAPLYRAYIDWQIQADPTQPANPKLTAEELIDVYHKRKRGSQAENYDLSKMNQLSDHYGYVAEENNQIFAYIEWGGKVFEGDCGCYIFVWEEGYQKTAERLLTYSFGALKNLGFKRALGHMPKRMIGSSKYKWFVRYAHRIIPETEDINGDMQYQRDL